MYTLNDNNYIRLFDGAPCIGIVTKNAFQREYIEIYIISVGCILLYIKMLAKQQRICRKGRQYTCCLHIPITYYSVRMFSPSYYNSFFEESFSICQNFFYKNKKEIHTSVMFVTVTCFIRVRCLNIALWEIVIFRKYFKIAKNTKKKYHTHCIFIM